MQKTIKPRCKALNDLLMSKKGGAHDAKTGKHIKRAKAKQAFRKQLQAE